MRTTTVRRVLGESGKEPAQRVQRTSLLRVLGEDAHGEVADFDPRHDDSEPPAPPVPNKPGDGDFSSYADVEQAEADAELGQEGVSSALSTALAMWKSGSKYDVADYLLKSDFLYTDFVRMIRMLPADEAIELGSLLDELVPPAPTGATPEDLVSAVTGASPSAGKPETPAP